MECKAKSRVDKTNGDATTVKKSLTKHQSNSAQTRERLVSAAQKLYAERGIDAVSFNEITVAAGQKNRNALQYHFGNRDSLLQAIINKHANVIYTLRRERLKQASVASWSSSEAAAKVLVLPIADYVASNSDGVDYIKIVPQISILNMPLAHTGQSPSIILNKDRDFSRLMNSALEHLPAIEAKRRIFLAVSIAFHSIADIYRASAVKDAANYLTSHDKMVAQVVCSIDALFSAPPI